MSHRESKSNPDTQKRVRMDWVKCHNWTWVALFVMATITFSRNAEGAISGWKKTPTQYHIQTDEGNERFFRFQTYNGQYRKERRLDDGTVIGSYGWVDPTGYLRMTDYIADSKGYRVVKELMEYVGTNSIQEPQDQNKYSSSNRHSTKVANPLGQNVVFKKPPPPETAIQTVPVPEEIVYEVPSPTTPKPPPVIIVYGPPKVPVVSSNEDGGYNSFTKVKVPYSRFGNNRPSPQQLRNAGQYRRVQESIPSSGEKDVFKKYTTPLKRNNKTSGFVYKIPHQYHKEEWDREGSRQGSFGYVDPFGIRRVIHYDANNGGFQARRDFKYVGRQY